MNDVTVQARPARSRRQRRPSSALAAGVAVAALLAGAAAGCRSDSGTESQTGSAASSAVDNSGSGGSAEQVLLGSSATTATLHSVHVELAVTEIENLPMQSVNADVTNQPQGNARAAGDASIRLKPGEPFVATQFLVTDKTVYTKEEDGKYKSVGPAEKIYDPGIILNPDMGLPNILRNVQDAQIDGKESVGGVETVKVSGKVDASIIDPVVPRLGVDGGTFPVTLWIADVPQTPVPSGTTGDEKPSASGANLVQMQIKKDPGSVNVTLSNWNESVQIPNPEG